MSRRRSHADRDVPYEVIDERDEGQEVGRSDEGQRATRSPRQRRKGSWMRKLFLLLLFLAVLIALAPTIVTQTPLRDVALRLAGGAIGLKLEASSLSGGWMKAPSAENLIIKDQDGQPLIQAANVELDRTLVELIRDRKNLGTIVMRDPVAHVTIRPDGNNWQDALAPLMKGESTGPPPKVELVMENGHFHIQDNRQMRAWDARPVQLAAVVDHEAESPLRAKLAATLADARGATGQVQLSVRLADLKASSLQTDVTTTAMPLLLIQPLLTALGANAQLEGSIDLDSTIQLVNGPSPRAHVLLKSMDVRNLVVQSAALPIGDQVQLQQLTGEGVLQWEAGELRAEQLQLRSDVASVSANGRLKMSHLLGPNGLNLTPDDELNLAAQVDLARLANMMPRTLNIRQDTRIDSGVVMAKLDSRMDRGQRIWHGVVSTTELAATNNGRQVRWEQPVSVEVDAVHHQGAWHVRKMNCLSSFLTLNGNADASQGRIELEGNLDQLRQELAQFVDLGAVRMAGISKGHLQWKRTPAGLEADADVRLSQFQLALPNGTPLSEPELTIQAQARGQVGVNGDLATIDQANVVIQTAEDRLQASLVQPVTRSNVAAYPLRLQVSGDLGRWVARAAVATGESQLRADGNIEFDGVMAISPTVITINRSKLTASPCKIVGLPLPIDEPVLNAEIIGSYDVPNARWVGGDSNIVSSTFAARCNNLQVDPQQISGDIACRGNLERIMRLLKIEKPTQRLQGEFSGSIRLVAKDGATHFGIEQRLDNFKVLHRNLTGLQTVSQGGAWDTAWTEPFVDLKTKGTFRPQADQVDFEQLTIGLDSVELAVAGKIADLRGRLQSQLDGTLSYDLQRLTSKLKPLTGNSIHLEGNNKKAVALRGPLLHALSNPDHVTSGQRPLLPMDLVASAGFQWDAAMIEGFRVGGGSINTSLEQATVRFDTVQIPVSEGKIHLAPQVSFRTATPLLTLPPGPVVERLNISPEMTSTWMKYVAPMMADATRIQGKFSAEVSKMGVPLTDPKMGQLAGTLTIHGAQAGPGPLAQQLFSVVESVKAVAQGGSGGLNMGRALELLNNGKLINERGRLDPTRALGQLGVPSAAPGTAPPNNAVWLTIPEHQVKYQVAQGRVYHEGMRVMVDNVELKTTGSVGFDETLNMVAELPVSAKWIGNNQALAGLQGQVLRIPIGGTIRSPRIDNSAVRTLTKQLLQGAAANALGGLGNNLGGQLFGQGPAGEGGIPHMTPTGVVPPPSTAPAAGAPAGASAPTANPPANDPLAPVNNAIQNGVNKATGNLQRELDKKLNNLFNR